MAPRQKRSWSWRRYLLRGLSFLAALYIWSCEVLASIANKSLVVGVFTRPKQSITYASHHILPLLHALMTMPNGSLSALDSSLAPSSKGLGVLYIDQNATSLSLSVQPHGCFQATAIDYLYNATYLDPLLRHSLAGSGWNLALSWVLVDCSFAGRVKEGTSVVKVHLVDWALTEFATFLVQTLTIRRPTKQRRMPGGAAFLTTAPFSAMHLDDQASLVARANATYFVSLGFSFPYEWECFEPVHLVSLEPASGEWCANVVSTNEQVHFAGTAGLYRQSPDIQALFNYFYWALPANPLAFAGALEYVDVSVFKDSRGWFRFFIGLGISFNLALNAIVAVLAMSRMWLDSGDLWMPDIYPSIQHRATVRVWLLLLASVVDQWWYPFQCALNQASYRTGYTGTMDFNDIPRADNLMLCLAVSATVASWLHIRIHLWAVVAAYVLCFHYRLALVNQFGLFLKHTNEFVETNFWENIVRNDQARSMNLWAYHEKDESKSTAKLIITEYTWLLIAIGVSVVYVVIMWIVEERAVLRLHPARPAPPTVLVAPAQPAADGAKRHWARRSTLYSGLRSGDIENTHFERSVGRVSGDMVGFVAPTLEYIYRHHKPFVSPEAVWLLGYVVVNDCLVVAINDYMYVVCNAVLRSSHFVVYGYQLDGDTIERHMHCVAHDEIRLGHIWRVSLKSMR